MSTLIHWQPLTTFQNPSWKRKTGYSESDSEAHQLQPFMQKKVLPRLRQKGVAPPGDICVYIHLFGICTYKLTAPFFLLHFLGGHPYRPAYLPNFDKRSVTMPTCMSIGAHCIPHCKILIGKERPAALNETVMHICCNRSWKKKEQEVAHAAQGGCCPT